MNTDRSLVMVSDTNYDEFMRAEKVVLILTKSDCASCASYSEEIEKILEQEDYRGIAFGKIVLDQRGSLRIKKENKWIASLEYLPYTVLYRRGQKADEFAASSGRYLQEKIEDNLL